MRTETQIFILLILLAIFPLINLILQSNRLGFWLRKPVQKKKPRIVKPLKPKTPEDCLFCQAEKACPPKEPQTRQMSRPWSEVRNRRGRKKGISTQGYACNNRKYDVVGRAGKPESRAKEDRHRYFVIDIKLDYDNIYLNY